MFSRFDKLFAGGIAVWLTQLIVAMVEYVGAPTIDGATETWITSAVAAFLVWAVPNKV